MQKALHDLMSLETYTHETITKICHKPVFHLQKFPPDLLLMMMMVTLNI